MNQALIAKKVKMIRSFMRKKECIQFLENLRCYVKEGGINRNAFEELVRETRNKMADLELTSVENNTLKMDSMSNIRWPKSLYIEFIKRLHRYEELICVSGYATYIRRAISKKGYGRTFQDMVRKKDKGDGFKKLEKRGLLRDTMEAVVLEHPQFFAEDIVSLCREKLGYGK